VAGEGDGRVRLSDPRVERVATRVRSGTKYNQVALALIARLAEQELLQGRDVREAAKATRRRRHQVAGAYLSGRIRYNRWVERLCHAREAGQEPFRRVCLEMMRLHASTRERLPIVDRFYAETMRGIAPIHSVIDVGCGLGPLAISWMPLAEGATYHAYDVYHDLAAFLNAFLPLAGVQGHAEARDAIVDVPECEADLALVLKLLPCAEQLGRGYGLALLDRLNAPHLLVSFPVQSLGGRDKGMARNYQEWFLAMTAERRWEARRFAFPGELVFLVDK